MMKIKWIGPHSQTRAGEMKTGGEYDIDAELGKEFVRRGLAESATASKPTSRKAGGEE